MMELGLISQSKGKYFDKFRNRLIFLIFNVRGDIIGFGGRAIGDDMPKYLNSPENYGVVVAGRAQYPPTLS